MIVPSDKENKQKAIKSLLDNHVGSIDTWLANIDNLIVNYVGSVSKLNIC